MTSFSNFIKSGSRSVPGSAEQKTNFGSTTPIFVKLVSYLGGGTAAVHGVSSDNVLSVRRPVQPQHMGRPSALLHTRAHLVPTVRVSGTRIKNADSGAGFISVLRIRIRMCFWPPGPSSGSISQRYRVRIQAKIVRKTLIL